MRLFGISRDYNPSHKCLDPPFAKLIRGCWFATVVVMSERSPDQIREQIRELLDSLYRLESGRILATLIRLLGDFDLAEEAMHEAFAAALSLWPQSGVPGNPRPWLISTARFKAIDTLRRRARFDASQDELARYLEAQLSSAGESNEAGSLEDSFEDVFEDAFEDDRLRLIFTCCHPSLPPEARVALTLREVCGLTTEEIAKAFLITPRTLAQRIVRAKAKIRETRIPYEVPSPKELPERLGAVLHVIYLVFNEGYLAAAGAEVTRAELTGEAIRLGRLLTELQPEPEVPEPEVIGLLALMLLQESRHAARTSPTGDLILLENQDRSLWNREQIAEGLALLERALKSRRFGPYTLQAAIVAVHAEAESAAATDWRQIVALYDQLLRIHPSPVVQLNRAVAVAMCDGPEAGLAHIDAVLEQGELANYYLLHSARADMYRRLGRTAEARSAYEKALALTQQEPERHFLQERIRQLK
ncbi:MAG TPA: RNA polymerase sigma factor [Pyrinomonadaceae bacterium]|jgi:RNA polymerase sigma-70 factor (ECF subfamily)|nr:RNA polymerase sigma factor [Pyrinomonadaceae bacterium]